MRFPKVAVPVVLALSVAAPVSAVDLCFEGGFNDTLFVAKGYKRPPPGKCRSLAGYEASTPIPYPATGTACLSASGTKLYVNWNYVKRNAPLYQFSTAIELPYPALSGGSAVYAVFRPDSTFFSGASLIDATRCNPAPIP